MTRRPPSAINPADKILPRTETSTSPTASLTAPSANTRINISLSAGRLTPSRSLHTQTKSFCSLNHTPFSLPDINAHPRKLYPLVLSYYLTEHQQIFLGFFFFSSVPSSRWCEWLSRLDLISAAPIWIWKGDRHTHNQKVCHIPT